MILYIISNIDNIYMSTSYYSQYKTDKESENPLDTVSCITFNSFQNVGHSFLASSWDGFVRCYEI